MCDIRHWVYYRDYLRIPEGDTEWQIGVAMASYRLAVSDIKPSRSPSQVPAVTVAFFNTAVL